MTTAETTHTHIDDWIDADRHFMKKGEVYARFVLDYKRQSASRQMALAPYMKQFKLYATWKGKRYRVTGASRMGDVWLAEDLNQDSGYDHRVFVNELSGWSDKP